MSRKRYTKVQDRQKNDEVKKNAEWKKEKAEKITRNRRRDKI